MAMVETRQEVAREQSFAAGAGGPEQDIQLNVKDRIRSSRLGRFALASTAALGVGWGMLQLSHPSVEKPVGPLRVSLMANGEGGLKVLGEDLDSPAGFVGVEANLEAPYPRDITTSVDEVGAIAESLRSKPNEPLADILTERYSHTIEGAGKELVLRSGLLVALTGGAAFAAVYELMRPTGERRRPLRMAAIGTVGMAGAFGGNVLLAINTFDTSEAGREMDQALTPHIEDYFTDKTTKTLIDYQKISSEISKNLVRLDRYGETMSQSRTLDTELVWTLVASDPHFRNPFDEIEAIDRVFGADMNIWLGDFTNRGTKAENETLSGLSLFGVDFQGLQDIRRCDGWNPEDPVLCDTEGKTIPQAYVLGNHDTKSTGEMLESIGLKDLNMKLFKIPGIEGWYAAVEDGCFAPDANCHTSEGDHEANFKIGEKLKAKLERLDITPNAIFTSHHKTAEALAGMSPVIFSGERHEPMYTELPEETELFVVGTAGQAFGRGNASASSVTVFGSDPANGEVRDCRVVSWQGMNASIAPTVELCEDMPSEK